MWPHPIHRKIATAAQSARDKKIDQIKSQKLFSKKHGSFSPTRNHSHQSTVGRVLNNLGSFKFWVEGAFKPLKKDIHTHTKKYPNMKKDCLKNVDAESRNNTQSVRKNDHASQQLQLKQGKSHKPIDKLVARTEIDFSRSTKLLKRF